MQKKIADFSKLPFMLKNTLDHLNSIRERAEVRFEGITSSSLAIINKEELLEEWQVLNRDVFQEKVMMEKNKPALHLCKTPKTPWKQVMLVYFQKVLK